MGGARSQGEGSSNRNTGTDVKEQHVELCAMDDEHALYFDYNSIFWLHYSL